ncbi:hypothetical protein RF11_15723 [Thelohanellus kitauei]|uniref:Uncharacterized protein n=1 Tax=Thelohanellus kitauei TaxID=669202 RepID=A0A0C2IX68_THEKT|nr:hypothetical protein RF11_15723 [Thelohanellus kitauei]
MEFILAKFHAYLKTESTFFRIGMTIPAQIENANEHARQNMLKKRFIVDFPMPEIASCQSVVSANEEGKTKRILVQLRRSYIRVFDLYLDKGDQNFASYGLYFLDHQT